MDQAMTVAEADAMIASFGSVDRELLAA